MHLTRTIAILLALPGAMPAAEVTSVRIGDSLAIRGRVPTGLVEVELRIESSRNAKISTISDVSPLAPPSQAKPPEGAGKRNIFYPVVDVAVQPGLEGILEFTAAPARCLVNENFFKQPVACGRETIIPSGRVAEWENTVLVEPGDVSIARFYLRLRLPVIHGSVSHQVALLSRQWSGRVSVHAQGRELACAEVAPASAPAIAAGPGGLLDAARLRESIAETAAYLVRAQNRDALSPTVGGLYLFYDLDAATYRSNYWIWGWGPAVRALLEADRIPEVASRFAPGQLRRVADEIGRASLRFMVEDERHPARGVPVSRWNRSLTFASGFEERVSVADAQFLAGWAWIPLYRATGNRAYLDAAKTLAAATGRLLNEFNDVIPQDYYEEPKQWSEHILDESGFGTEGLAELFEVTGDAAYRDIARTYMNRVRGKLERPDGLWERGWNRVSGIMPATHTTRGMGWAMEGLLAAHRAAPADGYLDRASRMAEHLMRWQHPDGSWSFFADKPVSEVGVGEKATALWSLLFYRLHAQTGDPRHLEAARRALGWCVANQYRGPDPEARGGLVGVNPQSAVGYRHWFRVACAYTSGFFGMAAVEELKLKR
jgi:rhamnogalacturonyl hydrolase YesR